MDPLAIAGAFANIISLIGMFKAERHQASENEYEEFLEWLETNRHTEILEAISSNKNLVSGLGELLNQNHQELLNKILQLDSLLLHLASHINGFSQLANAFPRNNSISNQAMSILRQLHESGGSFFLEIKTMGGHHFQIMDRQGNGRIKLEEPRFIEDDLRQLCSLGLLHKDYNGKGARLFYITRSAAELFPES
ncbi:hypothetical protein BWD09_00850 [Neisseria dentiae]|uniref:Uncharacterized protein n=1 Tax=Neisseria dentiae TaxID=194197 RepID=A0A1X3DHA9_9NEIS|nr:hypothetical protein [Neisseria dentiae]OSI18837.1 hypothetical protein BWD09_00850 [Neisseria dentiae]QMT46168.1 hypothetical protein H3L92_05195 [Neisseria dentiae]STZ52266.1 Uncharacterised protein [Neisseria dentiae]